MDNRTTILELKNIVDKFVAERQWKKFHNPKNLSMSIAIEAAELMELYQWVGEDNMNEASPDRVREELADVFIYSLAMANATGIDLASAVRDKLEKNALKYPRDKFLGRYR